MLADYSVAMKRQQGDKDFENLQELDVQDFEQ
jgi:hypothetical protein